MGTRMLYSVCFVLLYHFVLSDGANVTFAGVTTEKSCFNPTLNHGLQCNQIMRGNGYSRYSTLNIRGTYTVGEKTDLFFESPWSIGLPRDGSNRPVESKSLFKFDKATKSTSSIQPTNSSSGGQR